MIRFIIILILVLIVTAFSYLLIDQKGYILITMGDLIYEATVFGFVTLLALSMMVLYGLYLLIRGVFRTSGKAWHFIAHGSEEKAMRLYEQGLAAYLVEDFAKAEKLLVKSAPKSSMTNTAWLFAASAANKQNMTESAKQYLRHIAENTEGEEKLNYEALLVAGKLNLDDAEFSQARQLIDKNKDRVGHKGRMLSLDIEVCLHEKRYLQAIEYLRDARKDKAIDDTQIEQWETLAFTGYFQELISEHSVHDVEQYFSNLSRKERNRESIILAYANVLGEHGLTDKLEDLVLPLLKKQPSQAFINGLKDISMPHSPKVMTAIQKHLQKEPDDPVWLSAFAYACVASRDWEKARKAFVSLLKVRQLPDDLQAYAKVLQTLGEHEQANRVYQEIMAQA
ncbi:heme biosynthesis HemY N-terminal domain-containing protein [Thalassotalea litorea]|uniref:heme biosynthesis HemY N-terminal domain-containing protein n=1 Tax=Thalassotalea litorea TaxID=2020715 RepID=UPI0037361B8C